jgi:pimeloyl-ACP methyl ester carboxylesterase
MADGIGEPVTLIGFSLGASVSIQRAATVPHQVAAAALIEPPLALREIAWTETANTEGDDAGPAPYDYVNWVYETIKSNPRIEEILRRVLERNHEAGLDPPDIEGVRAEAAGLKTLET